jgi:DNA helicase-2/ATP-dependent DNA helicase PcrA
MVVLRLDTFIHIVKTVLSRDLDNDQGQRDAVRASPNQSLFIVAGPGSGKTTVLALRILRLIFVDGIAPGAIVATTFTRRAAAELRSRILGWGDQVRTAAFLLSNLTQGQLDSLRDLDINQVITGTIDSIAEQELRDHRAPGTQPPVVMEEFVGDSLMLREGLFRTGRHRLPDLSSYVIHLRGSAYGLTMAERSSIIREIRERIYHDEVDVSRYRNDTRPNGSAPHLGINIVCEAIYDYEQELNARLLLDFVELERQFLERMRNGSLNDFLESILYIFVDEYQDTNLLQEYIYFEMFRSTIERGGALTVVGDDDQSLYRFRGATVDLFHDFPRIFHQTFNLMPRTIYLSRNYRSTDAIMTLCNNFSQLDATYQNIRVQGKPQITIARRPPYDNYPILGLFRQDIDTLATDLARFIGDVVRGPGVTVQDASGNDLSIQISRHGSPADCVLLCSSPREYGAGNRRRLPLVLRLCLANLTPPLQVFNPRGQSLNSIESVRLLCGLMLECLDPNSLIQQSITNLPQYAVDEFNQWRRTARTHMQSNPRLTTFVNAWQNRTPLRRTSWENEIHLNDLSYKLVTWIPHMQDDIEGLVYLEAVTRTVNQAAQFSDYRSRIIFNPPQLEQRSIREAIWSVFLAIASGAIEINEDLLETLPADRVNVLSIHQAKGLQFPLVIVDVGSDFRTDHWTQAFLRFPRDGGSTSNIEDELRPFSSVGAPQRAGLDRAFDDLIRQYFVAYSRAQDVLLLVGLNSVRDSIPHIATGWDRRSNWHWGQGLPNLVHL